MSRFPLRLARAGAAAATIALAAMTGPAHAVDTVATEDYTLRLVTVAGGFEHPWGLAFLPDGAVLVTEREGPIRVVQPDGTVSPPLGNVPPVYASGQGGMLDIALDPDYADTGLIFFSYSEPGDGGAGTAVARARLDREANTLRNVEVIFRQLPKSGGGRHFGSRLVFAPDGTLFVTLGDRGERDRVQDFTINRGQVVRINRDGSIPQDNPFVGVDGYRPEIWSTGHRNPQGATRHPETGDLWTVEHGARGGDEINRPEAGKNYGWPVISYGRHYFGGEIGEGTAKPGYEQPVFYWDPSIAPSGMTFYDGDMFPAWQGDLFVGALKYQLISRLDMQNGEVLGEERFLEELEERIRAIEQGPDGALYILTDNDPGQLIRLERAD